LAPLSIADMKKARFKAEEPKKLAGLSLFLAKASGKF